jgi:hypothetical protein
MSNFPKSKRVIVGSAEAIKVDDLREVIQVHAVNDELVRGLQIGHNTTDSLTQ